MAELKGCYSQSWREAGRDRTSRIFRYTSVCEVLVNDKTVEIYSTTPSARIYSIFYVLDIALSAEDQKSASRSPLEASGAHSYVVRAAVLECELHSCRMNKELQEQKRRQLTCLCATGAGWWDIIQISQKPALVSSIFTYFSVDHKYLSSTTNKADSQHTVLFRSWKHWNTPSSIPIKTENSRAR